MKNEWKKLGVRRGLCSCLRATLGENAISVLVWRRRSYHGSSSWRPYLLQHCWRHSLSCTQKFFSLACSRRWKAPVAIKGKGKRGKGPTRQWPWAPRFSSSTSRPRRTSRVISTGLSTYSHFIRFGYTSRLFRFSNHLEFSGTNLKIPENSSFRIL